MPSDMSDEELKRIKRNYLRDCQNKEYRRLARRGELDEYLQECADSARRFAQNLIETGTFANQAWSWAVRVELLDSEMD